jgi:putative addiction module killer protein
MPILFHKKPVFITLVLSFNNIDGPGYRVYYGKSEMTIVILLCGGSKKSQSKDIQLAQAYWADFQRRVK